MRLTVGLSEGSACRQRVSSCHVRRSRISIPSRGSPWPDGTTTSHREISVQRPPVATGSELAQFVGWGRRRGFQTPTPSGLRPRWTDGLSAALREPRRSLATSPHVSSGAEVSLRASPPLALRAGPCRRLLARRHRRRRNRRSRPACSPWSASSREQLRGHSGHFAWQRPYLRIRRGIDFAISSRIRFQTGSGSDVPRRQGGPTAPLPVVHSPSPVDAQRRRNLRLRAIWTSRHVANRLRPTGRGHGPFTLADSPTLNVSPLRAPVRLDRECLGVEKFTISGGGRRLALATRQRSDACRRRTADSPLLCRSSPSGRRLHEDHERPHSRKKDGDERKSACQANSDPGPVSTG